MNKINIDDLNSILVYNRKDVYDLTDIEYKRLSEILIKKDRPQCVNFRGNILKTSMMEIKIVGFDEKEKNLEHDRIAKDYDEYIKWLRSLSPKERAAQNWSKVSLSYKLRKSNFKEPIPEARKELIMKRIEEYFETHDEAWIDLAELEDLFPPRQEVKQSSGGWKSLKEAIK